MLRMHQHQPTEAEDMYAWIFDMDHLAGPEDRPGTNLNAAGVTGPAESPDAWTDLLAGGVWGTIVPDGIDAVIYRFKMFDDDGELYYSGRMMTDNPDEDACYGPLGDYGMPNAGATSITYPGHRDMDCG